MHEVKSQHSHPNGTFSIRWSFFFLAAATGSSSSSPFSVASSPGMVVPDCVGQRAAVAISIVT